MADERSGPAGAGPERARLVTRALRLSYFSMLWGTAAGTLAIVAGPLAGSLGVLGVGLTTVADVAGSVGPVWRFGVERRDPESAHRAEARAALVVAVALSAAAVAITVRSLDALVSGSHPKSSPLALVSAGLAVGVLACSGWPSGVPRTGRPAARPRRPGRRTARRGRAGPRPAPGAR